MKGAGFPVFLTVQIPAGYDAAPYLDLGRSLAPDYGGLVLAALSAGEVECLEVGTPAFSILLVQFDDSAALRRFWDTDANRAALERFGPDAGLIGVAVKGLPFEGLPDTPEIPSTASVTPPPGRGPRAFMIIQGSVADEARIDQYRDIILPMIAALGAYYICFEIAGGIEPLLGNWPYGVFAISRWPDHAAGHAFWDSERYQQVAIPTRAGAGEFWVHFMTGAAG